MSERECFALIAASGMVAGAISGVWLTGKLGRKQAGD
jgi:hypothetical protein